MRNEVNVRDFLLTVDEPEESGGGSKGPDPLSHFLVGVASCLMTQYVRLAALDRIDFQELDVPARGHLVGKLRGSFERMICDTMVTSSEREDRIKQLALKAEACYVHVTLS